MNKRNEFLKSQFSNPITQEWIEQDPGPTRRECLASIKVKLSEFDVNNSTDDQLKEFFQEISYSLSECDERATIQEMLDDAYKTFKNKKRKRK